MGVSSLVEDVQLKLIEGEPATRGVISLQLEPGNISLPGKHRLSTERQ